MTFLVVFDTCTQARYYGDVHEVLALPEGAVIRYEYKRRLYTPGAAAAIDRLAANPNSLPIPALLMYGQKIGFKHGDPEPTTMLTAADSVFLPTRSAWLKAVAIDRSAIASEDVLYLHFQLRGFVNPAAPAIDDLVAALEAANELPFGDKQTQYSWISMLPAALAGREAELVSEDQAPWTQVVDRLIQAPTQFQNDIFWRVRGLFRYKHGATGTPVPLEDRPTNERVHADRWRRDYNLTEGERYAVEIQSYSPGGHGHLVPGDASIAMTSRDDDEALLKLAADPLQIVPNQLSSKRFSISTDSAMDTRFTGIHLETQVPNHASKYPPGALCSLTFSIRKSRGRVLTGVFMLLLAAGLTGYVSGAKPDGWTAGVLAAAALLAVGVGGYLLYRQFKLVK